ncbi:hypothetical protein ACNKHU_13125 [Shigella flexneri]
MVAVGYFDQAEGDFFVCTPEEGNKAFLHRFAAAGAAIRPRRCFPMKSRHSGVGYRSAAQRRPWYGISRRRSTASWCTSSLRPFYVLCLPGGLRA